MKYSKTAPNCTQSAPKILDRGRVGSPETPIYGGGGAMHRHLYGALGGTRTPNLLIRSQALYPLSYEGVCRPLYPRWRQTCPRSSIEHLRAI